MRRDEPPFAHPLPFEPEPVARLRARLPGAINELVDPIEIALGRAPRPGQDRRHVLDFHDGTRLILSRERPDGCHLSASVNAGSPAFICLARTGQEVSPEAAADGLRMLGEVHYRELVGHAAPLRFQFFSSHAGIPHWFAPDLDNGSQDR